MFSSYKRLLLSLTLRIELLMGAEHGAEFLNRTLIGFSFRYLFARRETDGAFNLSYVLYQKAVY